MSGRLYHYTSAEGLLGIVKNGCLWATQLSFLNDAAEFHSGFEMLRSALRPCPEDDDYLREKREVVSNGLGLVHRPFVASLSECDDDLSQWRAYCRDGGYAIGFPRDALEACADQQGFVLAKCQYQPEGQSRLIKEFKCHHLQGDPRELSFDYGPGGVHVISDGVLTGDYITDALMCCALIKHHSFYGEREWRLFKMPSGKAESVCHRTREGMIVPYVEFKLPSRPSAFWEQIEVVVGPVKSPDLATIGVSSLLDAKCRLRHADTSYRGWL